MPYALRLTYRIFVQSAKLGRFVFTAIKVDFFRRATCAVVSLRNIYMRSRKKDYVMTLLRMWRGEKNRVARINSLRGNPPLR